MNLKKKLREEWGVSLEPFNVSAVWITIQIEEFLMESLPLLDRGNCKKFAQSSCRFKSTKTSVFLVVNVE